MTCFLCGEPAQQTGDATPEGVPVSYVCDRCADLISSEIDGQDIGEVSNGIE